MQSCFSVIEDRIFSPWSPNTITLTKCQSHLFRRVFVVFPTKFKPKLQDQFQFFSDPNHLQVMVAVVLWCCGMRYSVWGVYGTMVRWCCGIMVLWYCGNLVLWYGVCGVGWWIFWYLGIVVWGTGYVVWGYGVMGYVV